MSAYSRYNYDDVLISAVQEHPGWSDAEILAKYPTPPDYNQYGLTAVEGARQKLAFRMSRADQTPQAKPSMLAVVPVPEPKPATAVKPKATPEERAANKAHKLAAEMPSSITLVPGRGWRRYPGMPEILISKHQIAIVQKQSRRLGVHYVPVPRYGFKGREAWHYWKKGKRAVINVKRAMYECGFWKQKAKVVAE
jgi:hypothetical protein